MKVVGIINHDNVGGAQKALDKLKSAYSEYPDIDFQILYLYEYFCRDRVMNNGTILVHGQQSSALKHAKVILRLISHFRKNKTDVIVCFLPYANIVGAICTFLAGVKVRIISHRNPVQSYNPILREIDKLMGMTALYTSIVCNSKAVKQSLSGYNSIYKKKVEIINNSISFVFNKSVPTLINEIEKSHVDSLNIVAVGRLSEQKNYFFAFQLIKILGNAHFLIAGHGELETELRAEVVRLGIEKRVTFLGNLSHLEIQYLLKFSDVYIQTSLYEGQSNSLLEAMNAGCLIFSSNITSQREVLENQDGNNAGVLLPLDDPKQWANNIIEVTSDPSMVKIYKEQAITHAKNFSPSITASAYLKLFRKNQ
jgi:glycosyltransferase involved in cell wall biosynthesis